ncbi:hypothetical protein KM043_005297 [Ampulex compressa]|nr:hypothetical protein KM043_005297 [Ampulex compressa]
MNIQVCNNGGEDTISRELPVASHPGPTITRVTIPAEPNYLDPTPTRANNRIGSRFTHAQQNGVVRLDSMGSSSGLISPQGTPIGSPSPPPMLPPPPPLPQPHPSSIYVNEEILASIPLEMEHNNNKSLRRTIQRSCTLTNTTTDVGPVAVELINIHKNSEIISSSKPSPLPAGTYMNMDISTNVSPLSPTHSISDSAQCKEEKSEISESDHAYMNISPGQEQPDSLTVRVRPPPLASLQMDVEDGMRHCYANLEAREIEGLRKRFSGISIPEKSPLPPSTPTGVPIREVNYAVLDLDKKDIPAASPVEAGTNSLVSPPESPNKLQKGYATIDFNKTAALSHSVNPNLVNDNEGSRKTRHNSTINDLAVACRHSSSISE